eukprot:SAG22_NODE_401_length_11080_cov_18.258082_10_plen_251_part_00
MPFTPKPPSRLRPIDPRLLQPPAEQPPVPFWKTAQSAREPRAPRTPRLATPGYSGHRPGESYSSRVIDLDVRYGAPLLGMAERAKIRGISRKATGYKGFIPRAMDVPVQAPGDAATPQGQRWVAHNGHDRPPPTLPPHLRSPRSIEPPGLARVQRAALREEHCPQNPLPRDRATGRSVPGYAGHIPRFFGSSRQRQAGTVSLIADGQPGVWLERSMRRAGWERRGTEASSHSLVSTDRLFSSFDLGADVR